MTADATTPIPDGDAQTDADVLPDAHRGRSMALRGDSEIERARR